MSWDEPTSLEEIVRVVRALDAFRAEESIVRRREMVDALRSRLEEFPSGNDRLREALKLVEHTDNVPSFYRQDAEMKRARDAALDRLSEALVDALDDVSASIARGRMAYAK